MLHLKTLKQHVDGVVQREGELVPGEFDRDRGKYIFQVSVPQVPQDVATLLGDCVYNFRASLDYLITALVRGAGNEESDRTEFPIFGMSPARGVSWQNVDRWWDDDRDGTIKRRLGGAPPDTKAALKPLQPFYGVPTVDPDDHPLAWLKALSNRDKHRRLNLLATMTNIAFTDAGGRPSSTVRSHRDDSRYPKHTNSQRS